MGAKTSLHMSPMKSMDAALSDENERRNKDKEWFDRGANSKGVPYHYDWWRRHLNFEIVNGKIVPQLSQEIPLHERLQNRLHELGFKKYKTDASNTPNVCMDFVIGGNSERMRDMAFKRQEVNFKVSDRYNIYVQRNKEIENWAMDTYRWAASKYGEENIVGFNVHLDETTPHIHMQVVPVGEVKKRGRQKAGEKRETKKAVSYSAVVGKTPEEVKNYLNNLHTDYHFQVGHKYGLERGTFLEDLTPEEQAERKHRTKGEYIAWNKSKEEKKKRNAELDQQLDDKRQQLDASQRELAKAIKKVKALSTMIANLEGKSRQPLQEKAEFEEKAKRGEITSEELNEFIQELSSAVSLIDDKIADKKAKYDEAIEQVRELFLRKHKLQNSYDDLMRQFNKTKTDMQRTKDEVMTDCQLLAGKMVKQYERFQEDLKNKRSEIDKIDKFGEIQRAQSHTDTREAVLYRLWPEARNAVDAIFNFGNSNIATDFTPQQVLHVEHAIVKSGTSRIVAAKELLSLANKDFDRCRTPIGWVEGAAREVMRIARGTHQRLNTLLSQQSKDASGSPSYITDLTDWEGNQIQR